MKTPSRFHPVSSLLCLCLLTVPASAQITSIIATGTPWRVLDNGTAPAANWNKVSYNDAAAGSAWRTANSSFGYKVSGTPATVTTNGATSAINFNLGNNTANPKYITTYFRKSVTLSGTLPVALIIGAKWDDGMIVYVNGVAANPATEILRVNMPADPITSTTLATAAIDVQTDYNSTTFVVPSGTLVAGANVIAVELHQAAATSSDVYFDLTLGGLTTPPCFGDATAGVYQDFEAGVEPFLQANHFGYFRANNHTQLQFEAWIDRFDAGGPNNTVPLALLSSFPGDTRQLSFATNSKFIVETERIDIQNYKNARAIIQLRSEASSPSGWASGDFIKATLFMSDDGVTFPVAKQVQWFNYGFNALPLVPTTLVPENAPNFWMVPTITDVTARANTTTNPPTWMNVVPDGWTAYNVPPGAGGRTTNFWRSGNLAGAATKGGLGYDDTPTPVNYNPLLDSGSTADVRKEMFATTTPAYLGETRINMRIPFSMVGVDLTEVTKVELQVRYDDGFAAWINGVKLTGLASSEPANDTTYPTDRTETVANTFVAFDITTAFKANVTAGATNVLAVRGFNAQFSSTNKGNDFLLEPRLVLFTPGAPVAGSTAALNTGGGMTTNTSAIGLIPNTTRSVKIKIEGTTTGSNSKSFYLDNLKVSGDAKVAVDLGTTLSLQLPVATFPESLRTPLADADGDGLLNLLEYAFGGNAAVSAQSVVLPDLSVQSLTPRVFRESDGRITLKFRIVAGTLDTTTLDNGYLSVNDLLYQPQRSDSLNSDWQSFSQFHVSTATVSNDDGTRTVTVTTNEPLIGVDTHQFFWVKVTNFRDPWLAPGVTPDVPVCPFPEPIAW